MRLHFRQQDLPDGTWWYLVAPIETASTTEMRSNGMYINYEKFRWFLISVKTFHRN